VKRVLFDENVPRRLRRELAEFEVRTVQEEAWAGLKNGELLHAAQERFSVLVTGDKRLQFQQNIAAFNIAVVVLSVSSITPATIRNVLPRIKEAIDQARPGTVTVVAG
jgi:predicted nuclease of predicted toxin-antitoxin system